MINGIFAFLRYNGFFDTQHKCCGVCSPEQSDVEQKPAKENKHKAKPTYSVRFVVMAGNARTFAVYIKWYVYEYHKGEKDEYTLKN